MREIVRFDQMFQVGYDVFVPDDIIECVGSVFLGPDHRFHNQGIVCRDIKIIGMVGGGGAPAYTPAVVPFMTASSRSGLAGPMSSDVTVPGGTLTRSVATARSSSVYSLPQHAKRTPSQSAHGFFVNWP